MTASRIHGLYVLVDRPALALPILRGGATILQLRDKKRRDLREPAREIAALKKEFPFLFIVNDDLKAAAEFGDGVHIGKDDPSIGECRRLLGPDKLVGYSSHSLKEAVEAAGQGADYVAFGAIFPSPTKGPDHPVQGIEKLRAVVRNVKKPVVAIGGINRTNIACVKETGVASCAMISAILRAASMTDEARFFAEFLK